MSGDGSEVTRKRVRELEVGMTIANDVHSEDGSCIIQAGEELTGEDIDRLKNWNIRQVKIEPD